MRRPRPMITKLLNFKKKNKKYLYTWPDKRERFITRTTWFIYDITAARVCNALKTLSRMSRKGHRREWLFIPCHIQLNYKLRMREPSGGLCHLGGIPFSWAGENLFLHSFYTHFTHKWPLPGCATCTAVTWRGGRMQGTCGLWRWQLYNPTLIKQPAKDPCSIFILFSLFSV